MSGEITLAVPHTAADVAALQTQAEADAKALAASTVETAAEYAEADAILTEIVRRKDAVIAMRKEATVPLYGVIRTIEGWFRPVVSALETCEVRLKGAMGDYRLAQEAAEQKAREAAAQAADAGDAGALVQALTVASAAAEAPAGRARVGFAWRVKRIAADMLPREWLTPDTRKIEAHAKAHRGDDPPVIPGVTFERVANVGAKR